MCFIKECIQDGIILTIWGKLNETKNSFVYTLKKNKVGWGFLLMNLILT